MSWRRRRPPPGGGGPPRTWVLPAAPAGAAAVVLPCATIVSRAGARPVAALLARTGRRRFGRKRRQVAQRPGEPPDQAAYRALLRALGAGGNAAAMERLVARLPYHALPVARGADAIAAALIAEAEAEAEPSQRSGGVRPANRPARRLRAAAEILARFGAPGPAAGLRALAQAPQREALARLGVRGLLGRERAVQLLVDAAYPFAAGLADGRALPGRWLALPAAQYGRTAALRGRLEAGGLRRWRTAESQALLDLERCYCRFGACAVCPLARLAASKGSPPPAAREVEKTSKARASATAGPARWR